jgi:3-hydroxyacyl-[acyl-carrier-protein] dehydratase
LILIEEILAAVPHRYPLLLVDRLLEINDTFTTAKGLKNVTINEEFFQGHYPGRPMMPGVLIVEALAQTAAAVMLLNPVNKGKMPVMGALDAVRFKRPVIPGDQLIIEVEILWVRNGIGKGKGIATVDGEVACHAELLFKLVPRDS